ncbi:MAG: hypothetical protein H6Q65_1220 [Firmicutes bacterium]|nr:hypothetical protein [Bacillota bacterium]
MFSKKTLGFAIGILVVVFIGFPFHYLAAAEKEDQNLEKRYTIDRFEEDFAILEREDCSTFHMPRNQLPQEAKEGDVVTGRWVIDKPAAERIRDDVMELLKTIVNAQHR